MAAKVYFFTRSKYIFFHPIKVYIFSSDQSDLHNYSSECKIKRTIMNATARSGNGPNVR